MNRCKNVTDENDINEHKSLFIDFYCYCYTRYKKVFLDTPTFFSMNGINHENIWK